MCGGWGGTLCVQGGGGGIRFAGWYFWFHTLVFRRARTKVKTGQDSWPALKFKPMYILEFPGSKHLLQQACLVLQSHLLLILHRNAVWNHHAIKDDRSSRYTNSSGIQ